MAYTSYKSSPHRVVSGLFTKSNLTQVEYNTKEVGKHSTSTIGSVRVGDADIPFSEAIESDRHN